MSTATVILTALLERLRYLSPEANTEPGLTGQVRSALLPVLEGLKQIEDADSNHKVSNEKEKSFERKVTKLLYKLEDLIESYLLEATKRNRFLNGICKRSSQQIYAIEKLVEELAVMIVQASKPSDHTSSERHAVDTVHDGRTGRDAISSLAEDNRSIVGMEEEVQQLIYALTTGGTSNLQLVSICGMGGIGKTTLARKLYSHISIASHFHLRSWVCVSQVYRIGVILQQIFTSVSGSWVNRRDVMDNRDEEELANLVRNSLSGRRYLIVLDDVWDADAWFSLRICFPDNNNGSRILITTRMRDVAMLMGVPGSHNYQKRHLTDSESWELLKSKLRDAEVNVETLEIGIAIARQCNGLPFTVDVVSGLLSRTPLDKWMVVLERLRDSDLRDSGPAQPFDVLDLSYRHLPLHLRLCFLYLGNFPEDVEIETDTLYQLWIAEGLIPIEDSSGKPMTNAAAGYLEDLVSRSLVLDGKERPGQIGFKSCRIHDLIREFCLSKAKEDEFFEVVVLGDDSQTVTELEDEDETMRSAIRRAIYLDNYECTHSHLFGYADYFRSLLFFSSSKSGKGIIMPREIPIPETFVWLRVLHLYGVDFKDGKFPKGVEKLIYLRYLSFRECYLVELSSSVGNMFYLQTLDLRVRNDCEIMVPDIFGSLERLKYLYLPLAYRTPGQGKLCLGKLKELEILDNFDSSLCHGEELLRLTNLMDLTVTTEGDISEIETILNSIERRSCRLPSTSLNIRGFDCHSERRSSLMKKVFNCSHLHSLGVEGYLGKLPELGHNLTKIVLNGSELAEDPMQVLQKLPSLSYLVLEIEAYVGTKMYCDSDGFLELRYLKLSKLYNLEDWKIEEKAMPELRTLVIENCKNLQLLPDGLESITYMQILEINSMPNEFLGRIQKSDGAKGEDFNKISHVLPIVKIDGQYLTLKEGKQDTGEDPQSSSTL